MQVWRWHKMNARLSNLRYATATENARDKRLHGTEPVGEGNGNRKLTAAQVEDIRGRYRTGERQLDIAKAYGISQSQVSNIVRAAHWAHLVVGA
jgi:DNA invertase Pin-like site-specific DNA recombinase